MRTENIEELFFKTAKEALPRNKVTSTEQIVYASCVVNGEDDIPKGVAKIAEAIDYLHSIYEIDGFLVTCGSMRLSEIVPGTDPFETRLSNRYMIYSFPKMMNSRDVKSATTWLKQQGLGGDECSIGKTL